MATKYICSWCALNDFGCYEEYRQHEDIHFDLDYMNGIQREYMCSFCPWGRFIEYKQYRQHEAAHYDIGSVSCVDQPPPKRQRYFFANINNFEQRYSTLASPEPSNDLTPIAGPSNVMSPIAPDETSVLQTGEGDDDPFDYELVKLNQRTFQNAVIDTHYEVKFNVKDNGGKLSEMHKKLENMFDDIIDKASMGLQQSDLGRIIIHHND